jgi:hypothetical protein
MPPQPQHMVGFSRHYCRPGRGRNRQRDQEHDGRHELQRLRLSLLVNYWCETFKQGARAILAGPLACVLQAFLLNGSPETTEEFVTTVHSRVNIMSHNLVITEIRFVDRLLLGHRSHAL